MAGRQLWSFKSRFANLETFICCLIVINRYSDCSRRLTSDIHANVVFAQRRVVRLAMGQ